MIIRAERNPRRSRSVYVVTLPFPQGRYTVDYEPETCTQSRRSGEKTFGGKMQDLMNRLKSAQDLTQQLMVRL